MPRTARASAANVCYHVLNRGNNRARVFHKDGDLRHLSITTGSRCAAEWRRSSSPMLRSRLVRPKTSVRDSLPDEGWRIARRPATFRAVSTGPAEAEQPQIPGGDAKVSDFQAFVDLLSEAKLRRPMRVLAFCVMPNHFHLALWPLGDAVGSADCIHFGTSVLPQTTRQPSPGTTGQGLVLEKRILPMFSNSL